MKLKILLAILLVFAVIAAVVVFWQKFQQKPTDFPETATSLPPLPVENFINQTFIENRKTENSIPRQVAGSNASIDFTCQGERASDFYCYEDYYKNAVFKQGIAGAVADLRQRYQDNGYVQSQCHPLTHVIGFAASTKFATVAEAYREGDSFCWSGYYHGVLEGVMDRIGFNNLTGQMNEICQGLAEENRYSFDHYNCVHGLGHGVMAITQDELFQSLEICDVVIDSWERSSCWSGAFMENIIVDNKNHFTKYLKPDDPLYPCNAVGEDYKGVCYLMQTSYMLKVTGGDFAKVFALCSQTGSSYENTCYQSLGRDASGRSLSNVEQTKAWCSLGQTVEQREHCVIGAVKDFISYLHSDTRARELCNALNEPRLVDSCLSTTEAYYKIF